ncbi:hypothetical protein VTL71DRAFT_14649 [Oculimacula yallundae]|uniref:Guanine nucleotide exchange factor LTE1 n=1 Tax=Oculimacula yallundae TaxID=86028 RepID=A0ABR4CJ37_9HELO
MMEFEAASASVPASQLARTHTPESLRQRQRDRFSPRGRFARPSRNETTVRDNERTPNRGIALAPVPRSRAPGTNSPELIRKKQLQEGLRKENSMNRRAQREAEDMKSDIIPDGGSASREGRQFTVAKVGNNGKIYLRPTIRPSNQRYPQPSFVFPITPPSTAGIDALVARNDGAGEDDSLWTSSRSPTTTVNGNKPYFPSPSNDPKSRHQRAHSESRAEEQQLPVLDSDVGAFKVVIERPGTGPKPVEGDVGIPTLEVPIPSYKLGTPRFSMRGTAFLRSSSYTTTDEVRSSVFSSRSPSSHRPNRIISRRHSDASPQPYYPAMPPTSPTATITPSSAIRKPMIIVPEMFDALTFKPACDHPSVVRYSLGGGIRAATPARLVAEITSPTFVDYDLLSDFFLTFRSFLETTDLLCMLIARLRWALARNDETGTVVRVRTFVAIRHWILNYFLDDYVVDYDLRRSFCYLLNGFVTELSQDPSSTKVPLKILGELKKCWRRVCALYWDGPEFEDELGIEAPIAPGGVAGSRNPKLDPSFWQTHPEGPPRLDGIIEPEFVASVDTTAEGRNFFADVSRAGHLDSVVNPQHASAAPVQGSYEQQRRQSHSSVVSEDFLSCSFPSRQRHGNNRPRGAHPVPASSIYDPAPPIATTPKALTGKRVRPAHAHKRSASFSDSFRDRRAQQQSNPQQPIQKVVFKSTELFLALPYAGSIVRGNLFPPGQAFVEVIAPSTPAEMNRATTLFPGFPSDQKGPSAMSGPGMKRLLGSVRRALSTRAGGSPNASPTQGSFPNIPPLGVRGATINRLPGTAIVPQARPRNTGIRTPMRIDLLGAEIAEDFKKAVREDAEAEADAEAKVRQLNAEEDKSHSTEHDPGLQYSSMAPDTTFEDTQSINGRAPVSQMTAGSKSILIIDDTPPIGLPMMTGALLPNPSIDTFPDTFMHPSGGPTPPSTPPEAALGIPRRSSHLLGQHTRNRSHSFEGTPSLVVDSRPSGEDERSPSHRPFGRLGMRNPRGLSYRSKKSVSLRRYASFHSGFTRHRSERSFDATTFSEEEDVERLSHIPSVPLPLRVLRRRPGGDLRAVSNVGDLGIHQLRRPMSTGSLNTYSESVRSSYLLGHRSSGYVDVVTSDYDQTEVNDQTFSLGAMAESTAKPQKPHVSLFSTHSSQPVMRPSFEKEAQMLAQIPDDIDDDGGVESALAKLEGKFEKRQSDASALKHIREMPIQHNSFGPPPHEVSTLTLEEDEEEKKRHRQQHINENAKPLPGLAAYRPQPQQGLEELKPTVYQPKGMLQSSQLKSPRSFESYNSIPLLERGLTDDGFERQHRDWTEHSILRGPSNERNGHEVQTPDSSHVNSFDFVEETDSMRRIPTGHTMPSTHESFLDSDSDARSDLSSEMSMEIISRIEYTHQDTGALPSPALRSGTVIKEIELSQPPRRPRSPPMTLSQALNLGPQETYVPRIHEKQLEHSHSTLPPTPEITPTGAFEKSFGGERGASPAMDPPRAHMIPEPSRKTSLHLPFILAFDSQVLAQQFTLIEKDALNEIDWKDLIEMRWKDVSTESRSWVEFLRLSEPRGVEVVIARFNLMVKWAVSECVLTQDLGERVRCIIKYIHIAAHCRRYRNFATMTQLTVALTSKDISRLSETWAYVPAADKETLRQLENLVTPTYNFYNLRAEMEGAGADQGCIPFVGIYTHDLLVNSERPSQIASTPTTEPLINFERCRTDATVVKNLLRLLEASSLYRFLPIEGITERCLWMAALSDEEISTYGKAIQE